jgi:hypothetical protein
VLRYIGFGRCTLHSDHACFEDQNCLQGASLPPTWPSIVGTEGGLYEHAVHVEKDAIHLYLDGG